MRALLFLSPALLLAACGGDGEGTAISIQGNGADGAVVASADKDGRIAIDLPGFKANLDIPSIKLDAGNFDLDGVKLPTGSTITTMNIAQNRDSNAAGGGDGLAIRFHSPMTPVAVRDWFATRLADKGYALTANGDALVGRTDDGKAFRLGVTPSGTGEADGEIVIGGE